MAELFPAMLEKRDRAGRVHVAVQMVVKLTLSVVAPRAVTSIQQVNRILRPTRSKCAQRSLIPNGHFVHLAATKPEHNFDNLEEDEL